MNLDRPFEVILATFLIKPLVWVLVFLSGSPDYLAYFLFGLMFLPEIGILFPGFRRWLKIGVEDGDDVLNSKDVQSMIAYYSSLICIRVYVSAFIAVVFLGKIVPDIFVYSSLAGGFGMAGVGYFIKNHQPTISK